QLLFVFVGEGAVKERLVLLNRISLVVKDSPAAANPPRGCELKNQFAAPIVFERATGVAAGCESPLCLNPPPHLPAHSVGVTVRFLPSEIRAAVLLASEGMHEYRLLFIGPVVQVVFESSCRIIERIAFIASFLAHHRRRDDQADLVIANRRS